MEVEIQKSLYPNINWRNFHLGDVNCRVTSMTLNNVQLRTPLNGCGTNYTEDNDMLKFWNMVKYDLCYFHCYFQKQIKLPVIRKYTIVAYDSLFFFTVPSAILGSRAFASK